MKKLFLISLLALSASFASFAQEEKAAEVNQYGQKVNSIPVTAVAQDGILVFQN